MREPAALTVMLIALFVGSGCKPAATDAEADDGGGAADVGPADQGAADLASGPPDLAQSALCLDLVRRLAAVPGQFQSCQSDADCACRCTFTGGPYCFSKGAASVLSLLVRQLSEAMCRVEPAPCLAVFYEPACIMGKCGHR